MTVVIRESTATTVRIPTNGDWTTPVLLISSPSGSDVTGAGSATLDTTSTTVATTATVGYQVALTSSSGFAIGRHYKVTTDGIRSIFKVTEIDGNTVNIRPALTKLPESGDTVAGVGVAVVIPSLGTRGHGYIVEITEGDREERVAMDVVRRPFLMGFSDLDARAMLNRHWPSGTMEEQAIDDLVTEVREEIRSEMLHRGVYPHEFVDPGAFRRLAHTVCRRLLADEYGLFPQGVDDRQAHRMSLDGQESKYMARIVQSYQPADRDDDGTIDPDDVQVFVGWVSR